MYPHSEQGCQKAKRKNEKGGKHLLPNVFVVEHTGQVTAPVAPRPACTLLQEFRVVFKSGLDFGLGMVLHESLPAVVYHPSSDKVVIIRIQLIFAKPPFLIGETISEPFILKDFGAISNTASGHARKATIHMRRGCTIEVSSLQVQSPQEVIDALRKGGRDCTAQSLTGYHTTISLILLKGRQDPRHDGAWPTHVIVSEHCDCCAYFWNGPGHLAPLIGVSDGKQADSRLRGGHRVQHVLSLLSIGLDCHQQKLVGPVIKNCSDRFNQFIATALQSRNDYCDILGSQFRVFRWRDWLKGPEGEKVHDQAEVTIYTMCRYFGSAFCFPSHLVDNEKITNNRARKARMKGKAMVWKKQGSRASFSTNGSILAFFFFSKFPPILWLEERMDDPLI